MQRIWGVEKRVLAGAGARVFTLQAARLRTQGGHSDCELLSAVITVKMLHAGTKPNGGFKEIGAKDYPEAGDLVSVGDLVRKEESQG